MSAHPCIASVLDAVAREERCGSFFAFGPSVWAWSGANARRAHAALARAFDAAGVAAVDLPGIGVLVAPARDICGR